MNKTSPMRTSLLCALLGSSVWLSHPAQAVDDILPLSVRGLMSVHISCTVNGGRTETIDFGDDLLSNHIDGIRYVQDVPLAIVCTAPVDRLALWIEGDGADFDANLLKTSLDNLALRFLQEDGTQLDLKSRIEFGDPASPPRLRVVPVKSGDAADPAGDFSATATMLVEVI